MKKLLPAGISALVCISTLLISCSVTEYSTGMLNDQAPVIIYRTKGDYHKYVPVTMNADKDKIVAYPAPADLYHNGEPALPVALKKGYLLDRRGIGPNTVFTNYTYGEYAKMKSPPTLRELENNIRFRDPFRAMYRCGTVGDYQDLINELNAKIDEGFLECTPLVE
jgi:hypothetical protein